MEYLMFVVVGILFSIATYLILCRSLFRVVGGMMIISHAIHLLILSMGGLNIGAAPLLNVNGTSVTDPFPQAMILTAIVIGFGTTSFQIVLAYRTYRAHGTDDLNELRGVDDE